MSTWTLKVSNQFLIIGWKLCLANASLSSSCMFLIAVIVKINRTWPSHCLPNAVEWILLQLNIADQSKGIWAKCFIIVCGTFYNCIPCISNKYPIVRPYLEPSHSEFGLNQQIDKRYIEHFSTQLCLHDKGSPEAPVYALFTNMVSSTWFST